MQELRRETEIDAPPERVWGVITDFAAYLDHGRSLFVQSERFSGILAKTDAGFSRMNAALKARVEQTPA
jgi:hypothetical protein